MNNKFLEEAKTLSKRWEELDGEVGARLVRAVTTKSLECQRLHNETGKWDCCDECKEMEKIS